MTLAPFALATGADSPVSIASSTDVSPSITSPSAGTFSPGLTRTRSPALSSARGTSVADPSGRSTMGFRRHKPGQLLQGPRGSHDRSHLQPMAEEHDVDEGRHLPEEDLSGQAEDDGAAVDVGGGDGQSDQGHHARRLGFDLADEALEEGTAPVKIDERRDDEEDIGVAGESQAVAEAQKALDHGRKGEDGEGRSQGDPEPLLEVVGVTGRRVSLMTLGPVLLIPAVPLMS